MAKLLPGFIGLGGTAKQVKEIATGRILSRRQYAQTVKRVAEIGRAETNEALAKFNAQTEAEKQAARPARGRTSVQKLAPQIKKDIVGARLENKKALEKKAAEAKQEKYISKRIEAAKRKRVKVKTLRPQSLKSGHLGARISFNDYADYEKLYDEFRDLKARNIAFAYAVGIEGVDSRSGEPRAAFVFPMRDYKIDEDEFDETMSEWMGSRPYFVFSNYIFHAAFAKEYAARRAERAGKKPRKPR